MGWSALILILLYVAETILIGLIHIVKMLILYYMNRKNPFAYKVKRESNDLTGIGVVIFFIVHYGFFIFVQMMVFNGFTHDSGFFESMKLLFTGDYKFALLTIFITKMSTISAEFLWDPKIHTKLPEDVFFEPYPRIIVQQFMVILGGWLSLFGGKVTGYLIVLIAGKLVADLLLSKPGIELIKKWQKEGKFKSTASN